MVTSVRSGWGGHRDRVINGEWEQRWMPSITWSFFSHHSSECSHPNTGAQYKEELEFISSSTQRSQIVILGVPGTSQVPLVQLFGG